MIDGLDMVADESALSITADNVTVRNSSFTGSPGAITTDGKNLPFSNNTLNASEVRGALFQFGLGGGGVQFLNNTITITSSDPGGLGDRFGIQIGDAGSGDTGALIRDNTLDTDNGGLKLLAEGAGAHFTVERNRFNSTASAGGLLLRGHVQRKSALQDASLTVRNNVFDGMAAFGGVAFQSNSGFTIVEPADFSAVEIINNSFRATVHGEFNHDNAGMVSLTGSDDPRPASYPVILRNNIFQGIGDPDKQDTAIQITSGVSIDADYDLFFGFDTIYSGGTPSAGGNDITGQDPLFTNDMLEVETSSPAVDAGMGTMAGGPPIPSEDYNGTGRPQNSSYDIGAHENVY